MHLIIGGACQGKRRFVLETYHLSDEQIFRCNRETVDFSYPCVARLEEFTYGCIQRQQDPIAYFEENRDKWRYSILICRDIFGGIVPIEADIRAWREATGRLCQYLSREASAVSRIFCGLEQRLK